MTTIKNIFEPSTSSDPVQRAMDALSAVRQFQQDWKDFGTDRVHRYFDNVDGNWIEEFNKDPVEISISSISKQLKSLGIPPSLIETIGFPDWWHQGLAYNKQEIDRLLDFIAKRFLLSVDFSGNQEPTFAFQEIAGLKFKLKKNNTDPTLFTRVATGIADDIASLISSAYIPISNDPLYIRNWILQRSLRVDLDGLLAFCWEHGIAVGHFNIERSIKGMSKFDGMVAVCDNRPTIIISSSRKSEAWLSFILAHELGHIASGHLQNGVLVDDEFGGGEIDCEETEADNFATQLLFGESSLCWDRELSFNELDTVALDLSHAYRVNSGFIVLNYAWHTKDWVTSMAVLKKLEPESNAPAKIHQYLNQYQHLQNLDTDSRNYLCRMKVLAT
ncbi:MAG: ImmA/IrrE family metallo-endopeptidase [Pseudanabaena sp. ELA607]|jgi:Zn-dependent peptidase ImmA (M78 family)